jgi:osmotically-inducible protein OsmY
MTLVLAAALGAAACSPLLPVMVGGAVVGGGLVVTDRRTTGTQLEDQGIERRAAAAVRDLATGGHVKLESYNRVLLITGEVPDEAARDAVMQAVSRVENVRAVINELALGPNSGVRGRSSDALLATRVKAALVDNEAVQSNAFRVVVTRGNVYLLGRVTEREAHTAVELVRGLPGVEKVVPAYELISEEELAASSRAPSRAPAGETAAPGAAPGAAPAAAPAATPAPAPAPAPAAAPPSAPAPEPGSATTPAPAPMQR